MWNRGETKTFNQGKDTYRLVYIAEVYSPVTSSGEGGSDIYVCKDTEGRLRLMSQPYYTGFGEEIGPFRTDLYSLIEEYRRITACTELVLDMMSG